MGHWTQSRVGSGHWRRVWVSDVDEERSKRADEALCKLIQDAYKRFRDADTSTLTGRHEKNVALHDAARIVGKDA